MLPSCGPADDEPTSVSASKLASVSELWKIEPRPYRVRNCAWIESYSELPFVNQ